MDRVIQADAVFDGDQLHPGAAVVLSRDRVAGIGPPPPGLPVEDVGPGWLLPGFVDLQVNGGGGAMLGPEPGALDQICDAHARLGATSILPTLITDTPERTRATLVRVIEACRAGRAGVLGLHLEGPHLDPRRAGAHDPSLFRPLTAEDLQLYLDAARALPALMITLAPAMASVEAIATLARAGVVVSLGHTEASESEARAAFAAGARAVTHLWNAMSPLHHRAPGLVGAALCADVALGLIADGHHVADCVLALTLAARRHRVFLVSDAMAVAGTEAEVFAFQGREIRRAGGRLVLPDGTLAGADLTLDCAIARVATLGCPLERAFAMATSIPADLIGATVGRLRKGWPADLVHLGPDLRLSAVWQRGQRIR